VNKQDLGRSMGKFFVGDSMVNEPQKLAGALCKMKFVPLRVEHYWEQNGFWYTGISPMFREVIVGYVIPEYRVVINGPVVSATEVLLQ